MLHFTCHLHFSFSISLILRCLVLEAKGGYWHLQLSSLEEHTGFAILSFRGSEMAAEAGEAQQLANALIQAATQAADAMNAMTTFQQAQQAQAQQAQANGAQAGSTQGATNVSSKFSHAGKMVRMPDPFSAIGVDAEQAEWPDFLLNLQAWLFAADPKFEDDLIWKYSQMRLCNVERNYTQFSLDCYEIDHSRYSDLSLVVMVTRYIANWSSCILQIHVLVPWPSLVQS